MPAALWLIGLPVGAATIVFLLRRMWAGAILATLTTLATAWLVITIPAGAVLSLLGRTVELDRLTQMTLLLLFMTTAMLFILLILLSINTHTLRPSALTFKNIGQEGRIFYPAALVVLGFFVAANLSRHLGITAIFVEFAAILMVFVIQTERLESTRAALRFLVLISLTIPLFLLAAHQIDVNQLRGGTILTEDLEQIALLISAGFAVWLASVPFHGWLTGTAAESSPPTAAFVLIAFPLVAFSTFMQLLIDSPWLVDSQYLVNAIIFAGLVTAVAAGAAASVQRGFCELLGYAALYNLGCILVMLGLGGSSTVITVMSALTVRALALVLIAASLSTFYLNVAGLGFAEIKGGAFQLPIASLGILVGGLTLAGAPFTAGFAPQWQMLRLSALVDTRWSILLVIGGFGVVIGYLRGFAALMAQDTSPRIRTGRMHISTPLGILEPVSLLVFILILTLTLILLGLFPALLIEPLQTFSIYLSFPIR